MIIYKSVWNTQTEEEATEYCMKVSKKEVGFFRFDLPNGGWKEYSNGDLIASYYPKPNKED